MTYCVTSDKCELPRGAHFTTLPLPAAFGDLCLFDVDGLAVIGRWCPNYAGSDWILVPGHRIRLTGKVLVRIVGLIIPAEESPEEIGDLTEDEHERALKIARSLR
jgi:hypothetical protein